MLYRPNFCSHCGEKIERAEWPLLASRRFCDICGSENRLAEWLPRTVVLVSIVLGATGTLSLFKAGPQNENATAKLGFSAPADKQNRKPPADLDTTPSAVQQSQPSSNSGQPARLANSASEPVKEPVISKNAEPIYYCGAQTKKGTPCMRKVKRPDERCWQHRGMPSMAEGPRQQSR